MKRNIKFRGKRIDNGEWVYGYFSQRKYGDCYIFAEILEVNKNDIIIDDYRVDTETVGQYIGLKDKNGKDIYEGDIIREKVDKKNIKEFGKYFDNYIYFCENHLAFERHFLETKECLQYESGFFDDLRNIDMEIIGNIHENKDLIKGG